MSLIVLRMRDSASIMWTGIRIVRDCSAIALVIAWRIHQIAYVENLKPRRYSNLSTARMRPVLPSWIKSRKPMPRFLYFFATEITRRKLLRHISPFASSYSRSNLFIVSQRRRNFCGLSCAVRIRRCNSFFSNALRSGIIFTLESSKSRSISSIRVDIASSCFINAWTRRLRRFISSTRTNARWCRCLIRWRICGFTFFLVLFRTRRLKSEEVALSIGPSVRKCWGIRW
jgi:hypothetical protein